MCVYGYGWIWWPVWALALLYSDSFTLCGDEWLVLCLCCPCCVSVFVSKSCVRGYACVRGCVRRVVDDSRRAKEKNEKAKLYKPPRLLRLQ